MTEISIMLVAIAIAAFLLLLVALLSVPVRLYFQVSWQQTLHGNVQLYWLFGLVRLQRPLTRPKPPVLEQSTGSQEKPAAKTSPGQTRSFAAIRQKAFRRRVLRFLRDIWRAIRKQDLSLRVRIGLGDPADTGRLWAVIGPVAGLLAGVQNASIEIAPEFTDAVFELDSSGSIRVVPLQIIYLTFGLLLSPSFWQGLRQKR